MKTDRREETDRRLYLCALAIVAAVCVSYIPAYRAGFIWDDDDYILLNPLLTEEGGLAEIWNPASDRNPQYYPLVFTTFRLERSIWGEDPTGYHVVNVALHAANAVLLLLLLNGLGLRGAWVVAGLFALHPVCVESVAWVTERKNVLSAFFYFLAALSYLRFDAGSRYRWFGVSLGCFVLALFSKTVAASLPIALGLILWWRRRPFSASRIATLGSMVVIGFVLGMITRSHEYRHVLGGTSPFGDLTFPDRILIAGRAFWFYPQKVLWPTELAFMYSRWDVSPPEVWQRLFPLAGVALAVALFALRWRGKLGRGPVAAVVFYAVTIFPALGFVDVAPMRFSSVADHFQYLACIGTLSLVVGAVVTLIGMGPDAQARSKRSIVAGAAAVVVMGLLGRATYRQAGIYHDLGTLWADTVKKSPDNWLAQVNYGSWLKQQGDRARAAECFEQAARLSPPTGEGAVLANSNLASIRLGEGKYEQALTLAERVLAMSPDYPFAIYHKARALWKLGRLEESESALESLLAMKADPGAGRAVWDIRRRIGEANIHQVLAEVRGRRGDIDRAVASYLRAIEHAPTSPKIHRARLMALQRWRRYPEAIAAARMAIRQVRDNIPFRVQFAWILATAPDAADRDGPEALAVATELVSQLGDDNAAALSVLAAAQAELGRFDQAEATARQALATAEGANSPILSARLRSQITAYARGRRAIGRR